MSRLWIVGGPNGAGKSTLIRLHNNGLPVISPDTISAESGASPQEAGRQAVTQRRALVAARQPFILDTTFSGPALPRLMRELRENGWGISLIFVGLRDPLLAEQRVAMRVRAGEHDVPVEDIERRYWRSMQNLADHWGIADRLAVVDNSGPRHRLVLSGLDGVLSHVSPVPDWLARTAPKLVLRVNLG